MKKADFRQLLLEFMDWTSGDERPASGWFLSLRDWAQSKFDAAYDEENGYCGWVVRYWLPTDASDSPAREHRCRATGSEDAVDQLRRNQPNAERVSARRL